MPAPPPEPRVRHRSLFATFLLLLVASAAHRTQAQAPNQHGTPPVNTSNEAVPNTPIGRWLAEHTSSGGIGSWWDFRADGTLTMYIGAAVTAHVTHNANTLNVPDGTVKGGTTALDYKITGSIMNLKRAGDPDTLFTREGPAPKPSDPLLGRWRPNPPSTYSANPQLAARQHAMTLGVYVFNPDNTQTVRIPFISRTGTWDPAAHTFKLDDDPHTYSFNRTAHGLTLGQPPDNTRTETYLPDTLFPQ